MKIFFNRLLRFALFFTLFFALVNIIYLEVIMLTDLDFKKRLESINLKDPDYELLVLGNSFPEYGIDTELLTSLGIKSYNLGIVGSSDETSYIQLKEYLRTYSKKPLHVLHCVASNTDPFYNKGIEPIVEFTMKNKGHDLNDIPVLKFRWLGVEVLKKIVSDRHRKTKVHNGQIRSPKKTPDISNFKTSILDVKRIEASFWIGEIAKLCRDNGLDLTIIEMPGMRDTQNQSKIGPYSVNFSNGYSAIMYNCNSREFCKIFNPGKDWGGLSHLNQFGAARFTAELLSLIHKNNLSFNIR
ncbi:MAG: hypothetical protein WCE64_08640 [Bacteroidales bacterium]